MPDFLPQRLSRLLAWAIFPTALLLPAAANEISYSLPKDGKVSLAVYDAEGRMVRTLRSAEPQKAGAQTVKWDGLDLAGKPVPAGDYTWKLLVSQGMKAEYLLNLGVSSGIHHWIGQHGGPKAVAADGDSFTVTGMPEGSPLLVKMKFDGTYEYAVDTFEPAGPASLTTDGGTTYLLMSTGKLFSIDAATGKKNAKTEGKPYGQTLLIDGKILDPIPATTGNKSLKVSVGGARYLLRVKAGQENESSGSVTMKSGLGGFEFPATGAGKFTVSLTPEVFKHPAPKSVKGGELKIDFSAPDNSLSPWAIAEIKLITPAESIDARFGELIATFPGAGALAWVNPQTAKIEEKIELPDRTIRAAVLIAPGTALALSGNGLVQVSRDGKVESRAEGLISTHALAFDPVSGGAWVVEGGKSHQIKFFDKDFQLKKTFGRAGGRKSGAYVAEDFRAVSGIAADGKGGFLITEDDSAPRRTAHFDADGKLIKEWVGGQQFYTFAAPDPEDPSILWMDSQWGWLMQVKVDWDKRDWKVLGTYPWGGGLPGSLVSFFKMAAPHQVRSFDLDGDGQKERYLVSRSNIGFLMKVDEAAGRLQPVAYTGRILPNRGWGWSEAPLKELDPAYLEAVHRIDPTVTETLKLRNFLGFAWADANGNGKMDADEFDPTPGEQKVGAGPLLWLGDDLTIHFPSGNGGKSIQSVWQELPASGRTATGAPIWDWKKERPGPIKLPAVGDKVMSLQPDSDGNWLAIVHSKGDGFTSEVSGMGHGFNWPANQSAQVSVMKWNPAGELLWRVGQLSSHQTNRPGQLHYPVHFAGRANGTIGVCDKVVQPVVFWTEDGLYAGGLFDRRADDGLPDRIYRWWQNGTDDFNPKTGRALFQYDMALGGSLIQRPNGEVIFIGSGWNNCPAFRVTGWDEFERQTGKVTVTAPALAAAGKGTGLKGSFFPNKAWEGEPGFTVVSPQIWFEPNRARGQGARPELNWANPQLTGIAPKIEETTPSDVPKIEEVDLDVELGLKAKPITKMVMDGPFTARWTGAVEPRFSENYTFSLYQVEGKARLWVDGKLVVETGKTAKAFSPAIPLQAGKKVPIQIEWSGDKRGELHLNWQSLSQPIEHLPTASLYSENK